MERKQIIAAYLRVSTDKQTVLNQRSEIIPFCEKNELVITHWCNETVSGTRQESERKLGALLTLLQQGDILIISEVSRLSRKMMNIMNIIHQSIEKGITIYSIKEGYKFDSSINSQVLAFAFGLCAEIERTLISQRTKEALARRRSCGATLGRPTGTVGFNKKLQANRDEVLEMYQGGIPFQKIGEQFGVRTECVKNFYLRNIIAGRKKVKGDTKQQGTEQPCPVEKNNY